MARLLTAEGARVTGIDPNNETISQARRRVPGVSFEPARAETLPFENRIFDMVVLVNALHHVPLDAMDTALGRDGEGCPPGKEP